MVGLPPDEEAAVLAVDVHGQSCLQAAALLHVSVDGLAKIRRRAYAKIADDMQG
nr:MAG TPA: ECF sigma factor [Caudoviricetes sp.]